MKKVFSIISIIFLIVLTSIIKNSSKNLETQIFNTSENLSILKETFEYNYLEYNYLSSPKNLTNYLQLNQTSDYISLNIMNFKTLEKINNNFLIKNFISDE
tara:strand:+ start:310 stop:612 length:303 start_codon:yes stop_codon:yes gene_type:complete